jgi:hypothetical protein
MTIERMIDIINTKISGLNTLNFEYKMSKSTFTKRPLYSYILYRTDYPEETLTEIFKTCCERLDDAEADLVEFLFDIIITEEYKKWKNYGLAGIKE